MSTKASKASVLGFVFVLFLEENSIMVLLFSGCQELQNSTLGETQCSSISHFSQGSNHHKGRTEQTHTNQITALFMLVLPHRQPQQQTNEGQTNTNTKNTANCCALK